MSGDDEISTLDERGASAIDSQMKKMLAEMKETAEEIDQVQPELDQSLTLLETLLENTNKQLLRLREKLDPNVVTQAEVDYAKKREYEKGIRTTTAWLVELRHEIRELERTTAAEQSVGPKEQARRQSLGWPGLPEIEDRLSKATEDLTEQKQNLSKLERALQETEATIAARERKFRGLQQYFEAKHIHDNYVRTMLGKINCFKNRLTFSFKKEKVKDEERSSKKIAAPSAEMPSSEQSLALSERTGDQNSNADGTSPVRRPMPSA